jgi:hypothetical protein
MANGDDLVELDDLHVTILQTVENARLSFPDEKAKPYIKGWSRVADIYVPRLRDAVEAGEHSNVRPHIVALSKAADAFAAACATGDFRRLHTVTMSIAALPGNPTIGLPPPWELFAQLGGSPELGTSSA